MQQRVKLECNAELNIASHNILVTPNGNEASFSFSGLCNDPIDSKYPLFTLDYHIEPQAILYGDGFQMSCQTIGTVDNSRTVGNFPDNGSLFRIYPSGDPKRYYNYLVIADSLGYTLIGFSSCFRFAGFFEVTERTGGHRITAYIDGENSCPREWTSVELESVVVLKSTELSQVYSDFVGYIQRHHPKREGVTRASPIGWSSHQSTGNTIDASTLFANLMLQCEQHQSLDYVIIERGYQSALGDWLTASEQFGVSLQIVVDTIKKMGKKPGVWLAPFIASPHSSLFQQHPDWFVHDIDGQPLSADQVTYAGLDGKSCYVLDTTNVDVQDYLYNLIRFMREELGIELFKLDGSYWGAMKGFRHLEGITSIEAYRMGLEVINDAANGAIVMACQAPLWPSLGLVDIMRVTDDVHRSERQFEQNAQATLLRSWQHRLLWQIDPDRLVLTSLANQGCERKYYNFHRTVLLASGGALLSGDPLNDITPFARSSLKRLTTRHQHSQQAASFSALNLHHGTLDLTAQNDLHCLFNYQQPAREVMLTANHAVDWHDFWTGEKLNNVPTQAFEVTLEAGLFARAILTVG
ncbi:alpha-galactosidase [Vibrio sp. 404]|uniref:Alpha-galactosidase n=1 Tax=Vibrio marinisediminis TaxID=2758441 RepID=A0A7W2FQN3_9VIBR|nr:alpha-galactosidase [Vibrio marinisediminis]MBA5762495.1 alpha-galactosidase [Vibrio marinisediminis]